ncbi:MAG TPA: haloacid dehalogenase-like hydrolase [Terriglobia bacterium]|nr:haloacid dehalogenase-like hydrolase [Terriglobia bacterium]
MQATTSVVKQYLLASDFDQTLSFNDSGLVLSELVGISSKTFERKVATLAVQNLVQQGGELTYLLLHDPEYRSRVRKEHLVEAGKGVRLKRNIRELSELLSHAIDGYRFDFHVISASPQEVIESALENIIPADHIHGTQLVYDLTGRVESVVRVNAGYGKVAVLDDLQKQFQIGPERIVYVGDGSSDVHVMLNVNRRDGFTIAVSPARSIAQIAKRTVLSDDALSVLVPILEEIAGWDTASIRAFFEAQGLMIQEWDRVRTDWLTIAPNQSQGMAEINAIERSANVAVS